MKMWIKRSGVALLIVIVFILLLSIAGGAILMLVSSRYKLTKHQLDRTKAFYLAEAGMHHALWRIRNNEDGSNVPGLNLRTLAVGSTGIESINTSSIVWGEGFATAISIEYKKTAAGTDPTKSSDDKFEIKAIISY